MKDLPNIKNIWESGNYIGANKPSNRVTVDPNWELALSGSTVGTGTRGPYRWWQSAANDQFEVELPNVKSIEWDRSVEQDIASCTITMNNHYVPPMTEIPELEGQYGKPGYFWFGRGHSLESQSRWNHDIATGAFLKSTGVLTGSSVTFPFNFPNDMTNVTVEVVALSSFADSITFSGPHVLAETDTVNLGSFAAGTHLKGFVVDPNTIGRGQCQLRITSTEGYNFLTTFSITASIGPEWDPTFEWENVLVGNSLLRSFEGYGAYDIHGNELSIEAGLAAGKLTQTGVWLVDTVTGGTNGTLTLKCRDIGALLVDQNVLPPLVPSDIYPLEYYPVGKSAYDSPWGSRAPYGSIINSGNVPIQYLTSSSVLRGMADNGYATIDKDSATFAVAGTHLSPGVDDGPESGYAAVFWEYDIGQSGVATDMDKVELDPVLGNYTCYVSIMESGTWQGTGTIPYDSTGDTADIGADIPYVMSVNIPWDHSLIFQLPRKYNAEKMRITFRHLVNFEDHQTYITSFFGSGDTVNHFAGIKDIRVYDIKAPTPGAATLGVDEDFVFTFALARHPTRGFWTCDDDGVVSGYGDAQVYSQNSPVTSFANGVRAITSTPDGNGYWVLELGGRIHAYGSATHYGSPDPFLGTYDMAVTHTGLGYWVIGQNGQVFNYGDAPAYSDVAKTAGITFMEGVGLFDADTRVATCCVGHPTKYGLWIANGNGEVTARGAATNYGGMVDRVFHAGYSDSFVFTPTEWCHAIECTVDGDGYWVAGASGHIAQFGSAVNKGPVYIYEEGYNTDIPPIPGDYSFFRALVWDLVRSGDGRGFYIVVGDGNVGYFDAQFLGQPGWDGFDGRWHDGNVEDYSDIVTELLLWAGWWLYSPTPSGSDPPDLFASIETTGIFSDNVIPVEEFDKKTIIDAIRVIRDVVGYFFWIDDDGSAIFRSPNFWQSGNFLPDGSHTNDMRVIDEETLLVDYSASHDTTQLVSEIVISNTQPDYNNGGATSSSARYVPATSAQLRGIVKPAVWSNGAFDQNDEQLLMAELIALHLWFSQRTGSLTCPANPEIQIDDQIQIFERNTSETYTHYVRGVKSSWDRESGRYSMTLNTHWLGNAGSTWAITKDSPLDPFNQVQVSRRVAEWQARKGLGLGE